MNNRDSHIMFKVILDKNAEGIAYGGCPAFLEEEIDIFLNLAQYEILSNKITGNNVLKADFESNLTNISEINKLVKTEENLHAVKKEYNEFILDGLHDDDRMTIISILLKYGQFHTNCVITSHTLVEPFKQTYNNIPWVETPVVAVEDNKLLVYVDPILMLDPKYAPRKEDDKEFYRVNVTYIKKPTKFDYTRPNAELDFPEDVMLEIINRAVVIALENIESQRQSTKILLNQVSE